MKRAVSGDGGRHDKKMKKARVAEDGGSECVYFDENVLFEVLKHVDAKTLAMAACVSKEWHKTAQDERLWELICSKHWPNTGCAHQQLRSVVLALGGFRRLHSLYLWPLSNPSSPSIPTLTPSTRLGKDEVHLSLSLLSIRYYEKMNFNSRNR